VSLFSKVVRSVAAVPEDERGPWPYLLGVLTVGLTSGIVVAIGPKLTVADASMLHLLPILLSAVRFGMFPSIATSVIAAFSCNFFFTRPYFGLGFADIHDMLTLVVFVVTAVTLSYWTGKAHRHAEVLRRQAEEARRHERETELLYRVSARITGLTEAADIVRAAAAELGPERALTLALPAEGAPPDAAPAPHGRTLKLVVDGAEIGTLGFVPDPTWTETMPRAIADEIARAIERAGHIEARERARALDQAAKLHAALLSSVSHDFRTPLTTIIGAASSLRDSAASFTPADRQELLRTIQESGERLFRYVVNLLSISRLDAGALAPNRDWLELVDIVGTALGHFTPAAERTRVALDIPPGLPLVRVDDVLIEQVVLNLLDNAVKYSPPASTILVAAHEDADGVTLEVTNATRDPPPDLSRLFERFYRPDVRPGTEGTGLGLSICKGLVEANGGTIETRRTDGAITFAVRFPVSARARRLAAELADD
jgi:two-component system, OmpR family, sensor histidine kinase KdpD